VGAGSRVAKKEESVSDFFRHSKKGGERKRGGEGKQEGVWMDLEEEKMAHSMGEPQELKESAGKANAAELAKAAFGGEGTAQTITDDHSMGEPEENVAISHSFSFPTCRITSYTCIQTFHFSCLSL